MIRQATKNDLSDIVFLMKKMHDESAYSLIPFDIAITETVESLIDSAVFLVSDYDDKIIGFLIGWVTSPWYLPNAKIAAEELLYVAPDYRNLGVASDLITDFCGIAKILGAHEVKINTATGVMTEAFARMAAKHGFYEFGREYRRALL